MSIVQVVRFHRLECIRRACGQTRVEFVENIGYHYSSYVKWRRKKIAPRHILVVAQLLAKVVRLENWSKRRKLKRAATKYTRWPFAKMKLNETFVVDRVSTKAAMRAAWNVGRYHGRAFIIAARTDKAVTIERTL